jgi:hypothetical protein
MKSQPTRYRSGLMLPSIFMGAGPGLVVLGGILFHLGVPTGWALLIGAVIGLLGAREVLNRM